MTRALSARMTPDELKERTLEFSLSAYRFIKPMFAQVDTRHVAQQLFRSARSVAANYRAACLARSTREWVAKLGVIREEADECVLWLLFIQRAGMADGRANAIDALLDEARQLTRIFVSAYRTSKEGRRAAK
jgi:four helix bundle protein